MAPDGSEDPNTDLFTAQRLWEQSEWDMHTQYRNAVGACVNWDSWVPDDAGAARLCRWLYEKVVSPIEDQLADEFNTNIEDVDNLLLSLGKSKDQRSILLAQQNRLSNHAVICALGVESNAVMAVMDEVYETLPEAAREDANAYTTGRIGKTSIVVVHLPGMGKLNAASSAMRLKSSFPNVGLCLVVGVCGGAPYNSRTKKDIVLGDIIISTGLKQVDFGRYYQSGFVPKDDPEDNFGRPVERLRSFLRMLSETDHYYTRVADATNSTLNALLQSKTGQSLEYPGAHRDHLYESTYQHQCRSEQTCRTCDPTSGAVCQHALDTSCDQLGCEPGHTVARPRLRESGPTHPVVHFGRVACSDGVMKSARDRDRLVEKYDVIGFEMEAAGAWDTFPTVIVKGVCDYADSHKNKLWQGYGAAVAASCMKALLAQWVLLNDLGF
ncbi:purine and uridine phosphorylase [Aspergillus steynii IBT 23096]|uniref:Purine and uridine phosphorylase n=1 Tax=Aspergillus steynii IBT 23096 TaxID=1392250 RepID=A0A2I2FT85_9EURO|nr:purine and uridine phosphorylase [Aspergillus steynii IBT 23096]PLB43850.1 purine and uridine phosphorylase [Aspergillus steynii IBT 23096]